MEDKSRSIRHLMYRAGFGLHPFETGIYEDMEVGEVVANLFKDSSRIKPLSFLRDPRPKTGDVGGLKVLKMLLKSKEDLHKLNLAWMDKMGSTRAVLRERMTLFWHDHFATSVAFAYLMQVQNNSLRRHALGSFREMLHAISKDPAMILYLNNQQNKKNAPNENFAREVMELFSLGEGKVYSEQDIKEAARAFTGWQIDGRGEFFINRKHHNAGEKTFLGQTGHWGGEDVIDMILNRRETAAYICRRIYSYFVYEGEASAKDEEIIQTLSDRFYASGYDIGDLMRVIFTSSWFYAEKNIGSKVKSPVDLLVQYKRLMNMKHSENKVIIKAQKTLGQELFFPPNVAGWKGGRSWIDASSLMLRMKMPLIFFEGDSYAFSAKPEFERAMSKKQERRLARMKAKVEWKFLEEAFADAENLEQAVIDSLIVCDPSRISIELLKTGLAQADRSAQIRTAVSRVMALPEFQLA